MKPINKKTHLIGYASGIGGADPRSGEGPLTIQASPYLSEKNLEVDWQIIQPQTPNANKLATITELCTKLSKITYKLSLENEFFVVLGGDHTSAIGTWSGVAQAKQPEGDIGLIWVDAHLDSHVPETSPSGNFHGMPVACLLGLGECALWSIRYKGAKIKPENLCMIGIRSFEPAEEILLRNMNVKIFNMDAVKNLGLENVLQMAVELVSKKTVGFGISLDLDSIDPSQAPGTGVSVKDGLDANQVLEFFKQMQNNPKLLGVEIVEFDPGRDVEKKTERLTANLIGALCQES